MRSKSSEMMDRIQERVSSDSECGDRYISWQWVPLKNDYVISIAVTYYNSEPEHTDLAQEDLERIENTINEVFGDFESYCDMTAAG